MKKLFFALLFISAVTVSVSHAQVEDWQDLEARRRKTSARGMYLLGGWAVGNIVANPIMAAHVTGTRHYFHETNTAWNVLNLGFAGISFWQIYRTSHVLTWQAAYKEQYFTEQLFLVNSTLNVVYISAGIYLQESAKDSHYNAEWREGSGRSLIFQGAFLTAFDVGMYFVHHKAQKDWTRYLQTVSAGPMGIEVAIPIR